MDQVDLHRSISRQASTSAIPADNSSTLHQYSCITCRSRKVKCNKVITGCAFCKRAGVQCIYTPRRTQKSQKVHKVLSVQPLAPAIKVAGGAIATRIEKPDATVRNSKFGSRTSSPKNDQLRNLEHERDDDDQSHPNEINQEGGGERLPRPSQRSDPLRAAGPNKILDGGFLFSIPGKRDFRSYHPSTEVVGLLWQHYIENVDILMKILYKPTVASMIMSFSEDPNKVDPSSEALLFAIYLSAVTAMSVEECLSLHGEEKSVLLPRYRSALEQALVQVGLLTTQEVTVLQALTLLIVCSPPKDPRSAWMLSGTALRIAEAMGLHKENTFFSLSMIEIEVRRRVWWTLCMIDNRILEDCGMESNVPMTFDTKLPLHVNDSDLDESEALSQRIEFTEMTVSLIKIEMAETILKLKLSQCGKHPMGIEEMEALVREQTHRYENIYMKYIDTSLKYFDRSSQLHQFILPGTRLIITKLWRTVYELKRNESKLSEGGAINNRLLLYNTEVLEITNHSPDITSKFSWFFKCKRNQWHAMAYLLIELCNQTEGPAVDRAWAALDTLFGNTMDENGDLDLADIPEIDKSILWPPLQKVLKRARDLRKQAALKPRAVLLETVTDGSTHTLDKTTAIPTLDRFQESPGKSIYGDPFLGSIADLSEEMNWENWDTLVQNYHGDALQQEDSMGLQGPSQSLTLSWW